MLVGFEVIGEGGEGHTGGAADVAHGGTFKAVLGKDLGCNAKDVLELGLSIAGNGNGGNHRCLERSFDNCSSWNPGCQEGIWYLLRTPTGAFQRRLLVLRGALQGGLQVEVGDETVQIVGMQAEECGSLGKAALGLLQRGEAEMFLVVAHGV